MLTADVIEVFGSATAVAGCLGVTKSAVSQWGEVVPALRQYELRAKRPSIDSELEALSVKRSQPSAEARVG